jgi:hypothetical protein
MSAPAHDENLLSSWKEISGHLGCDVRTCIRWEKNLGMPVHRLEGTAKSRVFAYKNELEDWLKTRLDNNNVPADLKRRKFSTIRPFPFLIVLVALAAVFALFIYLPRHSEPPPKKKPASTPQSTGPLTLADGDIVTTEFGMGGRLRVWRRGAHDSFREAWRIEPVRHSSLAIGDLDNDGDCEIVAPGVCRENEEVGERRVVKYRFFLNIYKPGIKDWWKTTFYSKANCIYESSNFEFSEIAVAEVDGVPGNEVVLITAHCLSVFKYDRGQKEFKLLCSRYSFADQTGLFLKSVAVANIDQDEANEIFITADEWMDESSVINKGWLLALKLQNDWPELVRSVPLDGNPGYQSLRVGDVIPGGQKEFVFPCYRRTNDVWNSYILGWDPDCGVVFDRAVYDRGSDDVRIIHLDVGELSPLPGSEIVVGKHFLDELSYYSWNRNNLIEHGKFPLDYRVGLSNVFMDNRKKDGFAPAGLITLGSANIEPGGGKTYLELFNFSDGFFSKWRRLGGDEEDLRVSYAAFGRGRH